jgi:hypothetical protein
MVSPEALRLNEILRNAPKAVDMDLTHQREAGEHAEDMTSEPEGVTYEEAYAVDGLWVNRGGHAAHLSDLLRRGARGRRGGRDDRSVDSIPPHLGVLGSSPLVGSLLFYSFCR